MQSDRPEFEGDAGAPLPDFSAPNIDIRTVAPALGVNVNRQPDYLDYDQKGRGIVVTMFANAGVAYLLGTFGGGFYGLREGFLNSPSTRFRVKLNSILNHSGRYGSKWGNALGVVAILYSVFEGVADQVSYSLGLLPAQNSWWSSLLTYIRSSFIFSMTLMPTLALFNLQLPSSLDS